MESTQAVSSSCEFWNAARETDVARSSYSSVKIWLLIGPYFWPLQLCILSFILHWFWLHTLSPPVSLSSLSRFEEGVGEYTLFGSHAASSACFPQKTFEVSRIILHLIESRSLLTQTEGIFHNRAFEKHWCLF